MHATQSVDANAATCCCMPQKVLLQMLQHTAAPCTKHSAKVHCCTSHKLLIQMLQHTGVHHTNCWFKCCNTLLHHAQSVDAAVATVAAQCKGVDASIDAQGDGARVKGWNKDMICVKKKFSQEGLHYHLKVHFSSIWHFLNKERSTSHVNGIFLMGRQFCIR